MYNATGSLTDVYSDDCFDGACGLVNDDFVWSLWIG